MFVLLFEIYVSLLIYLVAICNPHHSKGNIGWYPLQYDATQIVEKLFTEKSKFARGNFSQK